MVCGVGVSNAEGIDKVDSGIPCMAFGTNAPLSWPHRAEAYGRRASASPLLHFMSPRLHDPEFIDPAL